MTDAEIDCHLENSLVQAQERIAELETDLERTRNERNRAGMDARKDMLDKIQAHPEPLPRPDGAGWWWWWDDTTKKWLLYNVRNPLWEPDGQWLPATPPPAPKKEGEG